jgi:hypothetical protein
MVDLPKVLVEAEDRLPLLCCKSHHLLKFLAIESRQVILYVLGYRALQATYKLFVRFQPNVHVVYEEELVREEEIRDDDFHDALELLN